MSAKERINILVVDDQPAKLLSIETILADLDENILKASSANEALKCLLADECAVVLVDVCMPNMDGFELAELIRTHPRFARTAIIFISAVYLTDADRLRGYELGAVDYMPVPIIPEVLKAKVAVFAELYRKTAELRRVNAELERRIAELDESNERLRFADRMATMGTLAAGLGHDLGNLLLPVRVRLDTLSAHDLPPSGRDDIAAIREATDYLQRLARSLRLLALDSEHDSSIEPRTDVATWWQETEGLLRNAVGRSIQLCAFIPESMPPIQMNKAGLTQVAFNLVQNASDALQGVGDPTISVRVMMTSDDEHVRIEVADNGCGMGEEACRRCMEPFFTTKTRGLGTGLGLALVNGLVKRANGCVTVTSQPGHGTMFAIELPAVRKAESGTPTCCAMPSKVALVTLKDSRLLAHVKLILSSLACKACFEESDDADLLLLEVNGNTDREGGLGRAKQFAAARPERCAIVFGDAPSCTDEHERVIRVPARIKPSQLRKHISEALAATRVPQDRST